MKLAKNPVALLTLCLFTGTLALGQATNGSKPEPQFSRKVLTKLFISEGVAVGDVNKDGRIDVMAGASWFEAPGWKRHEIAKADTFSVNGGYSNSFLNFSQDVNQDGWVDLIRIDWPGKAAVWHENPQNKPGHWKVHEIYSSVGNESPQLVDVDGDGRLDLLCNDPTAKEIIWVRCPSKKGDTQWVKTVISSNKDLATHMYTHGLGFGDINGDGRKDVLINKGYWEAPADPKQANWTFHPTDFGPDCSQMYTMDLDGDGDADLITASAHNYGIWWHEQTKEGWKHHEIAKNFSQTHGLALADVNKDGHPDLVTGKRYFAHNGKDPGAFEPAVLVWYEYKPGKTPTWIPHQIDDNSGVGLHVVAQDIDKNGSTDIVVANKKGVHVFQQK